MFSIPKSLRYYLIKLEKFIFYTGTQVGVMIAFPLCGVLCVEGFDGGWPSIFYVLGNLLFRPLNMKRIYL